MHRARRFLGAIFAVTAACTAANQQPITPQAEFDCGAFVFTVSFPQDSAVVTTPDRTLVLPIAISASGARYSDGVSTFWEHQGTALLELPDTSFEDCRRVQP